MKGEEEEINENQSEFHWENSCINVGLSFCYKKVWMLEKIHGLLNLYGVAHQI